MNEKEKEMMERYIYEVVRHLPKEQRDEIRMELLELITDMLETEGETIVSVLTKLGNPTEFAKKYKEDRGYLISPEYYENYSWVMKIVLICVWASGIVSAIIEGIMNPASIDLINDLVDLIVNLVISGVGTFGSVTFVFAVLEHYKVKVDLKEEKKWTIDNLTENAYHDKKVWTPFQLSPIPDKKALISRGESLVGIIFLVIFCGLLLFEPKIFSVYHLGDKDVMVPIPLFNLEKWNVILPVLLLAFFIGFVDEVVRLAAGCYCRLVMFSSIITCVLQFVFLAVAIKIFPFWNPNFAKDIERLYDIRFTANTDILSHWGTDFFSDIILTIISGILILQMGITIYKTIRYGMAPNISNYKNR